MQTSLHIGPDGLHDFAEECAKVLLAGVQHQFTYPKGCTLHDWPIDSIKRANESFLKSLRGRANVYAIFVRRTDEHWLPVYVGERKSIGLRDRLTQHLISKNHRTGSMLEAVKTAVSAGEEIGVSLIKVQPESLRLYVEETIISMHKERLPWNTHG